MAAFRMMAEVLIWLLAGGFLPSVVIPAKAGTQSGTHRTWRLWAPAFAGVTVMSAPGSRPERQLLSRQRPKRTLPGESKPYSAASACSSASVG